MDKIREERENYHNRESFIVVVVKVSRRVQLEEKLCASRCWNFLAFLVQLLQCRQRPKAFVYLLLSGDVDIDRRNKHQPFSDKYLSAHIGSSLPSIIEISGSNGIGRKCLMRYR